MKKIFHGFVCILFFAVLFCSFPIALIIYGRKKCWIISEVDFDARDNGFCFFQFLREKHKEINAFYVISKKNINYKSVKALGNVVEPKSYKHILLFIASKVKASTLVNGCSPSYFFTKYYLSKHHFTGKNIALKHGIFKNVHPNYFKDKAHLDLICCGALPEYNFIDKEFGYESNVAQYTGLARFDKLHNITLKKAILIMPTWRRWLDNIKTCSDFESTFYFQQWNNFINDKAFLEMTEKKGLAVNFYIHPKLNRFKSSFNSMANKVHFLNTEDGEDIQKHLLESILLITDFSSVFFDFAYMKKVAVFYQFDEEKYFHQHYSKGYFDYRKDGFGPVCDTCDALVHEVMKASENNFEIETIYKQRSDYFFPLCDENNCERIFKAIIELL